MECESPETRKTSGIRALARPDRVSRRRARLFSEVFSEVFSDLRRPLGDILLASVPRLLAVSVGLLLCLTGVWHLEGARAGLSITPLEVGSTPATVYRRAGGPKAPAVIIAHGFAGYLRLPI